MGRMGAPYRDCLEFPVLSGFDVLRWELGRMNDGNGGSFDFPARRRRGTYGLTASLCPPTSAAGLMVEVAFLPRTPSPLRRA